MANFFEKKDRHVIPNWRSFENTAKLGELDGSISSSTNSSFRPDISVLVGDWEERKEIGIAGDVLGAALVSNQTDNPTVREISSFVLQNVQIASPAIISAAKNILKPKDKIVELSTDITLPSVFNDKSRLLEVYAKINELKIKLNKHPYNSINWIEIARYYSILGLTEKAERAAKNALSLSKENRFVLRSIARFFVHAGDSEFAHDIIRKSELTRHDPWLLATEISLATLRGRHSPFAKLGFKIVESGSFHPYNLTELASALATLEMKNASMKESKKLFEQSLIRPNDNSLAQAEWASQKESRLNPVNPFDFDLINSYEAQARDLYEKREWQRAIDCSKRWFFDLPFSKRSVSFGNEIASSKLKDHNQAVEIASLGLISHPNDAHLLNNIVYSLCLQDKTEDARKYLNSVKKEDMNSKNETGICLTATRGLFSFRVGLHEEGRNLYYKSIQMAKESGNLYLNSLAIVNYIREEFLLGVVDVTEAIPILEKIAKHPKLNGKDIVEEANDVIKLFREGKSRNDSSVVSLNEFNKDKTSNSLFKIDGI